MDCENYGEDITWMVHAVRARYRRLYGEHLEHMSPEDARPWDPFGPFLDPPDRPLPPKVVLLRSHYPLATTSPAYVAERDDA